MNAAWVTPLAPMSALRLGDGLRSVLTAGLAMVMCWLVWVGGLLRNFGRVGGTVVPVIVTTSSDWARDVGGIPPVRARLLRPSPPRAPPLTPTASLEVDCKHPDLDERDTHTPEQDRHCPR